MVKQHTYRFDCPDTTTPSGKRNIKRRILSIHSVPAWVAHMLATHSRLRDLDIAGPLTRIIGLGFAIDSGSRIGIDWQGLGSCHVPSLSNDPKYVGDVKNLGRFWYIADSLPGDLSKIELEPSIWSVLTCILWNMDQETLKNIRTANGRVWPPPRAPVVPFPYLVTGTHTPSTGRITVDSLLIHDNRTVSSLPRLPWPMD